MNLLGPFVLAQLELIAKLLYFGLDCGFDLVLERSGVVLLFEQRPDGAKPGRIIKSCEYVLHGIQKGNVQALCGLPKLFVAGVQLLETFCPFDCSGKSAETVENLLAHLCCPAGGLSYCQSLL